MNFLWCIPALLTVMIAAGIVDEWKAARDRAQLRQSIYVGTFLALALWLCFLAGRGSAPAVNFSTPAAANGVTSKRAAHLSPVVPAGRGFLFADVAPRNQSSGAKRRAGFSPRGASASPRGLLPGASNTAADMTAHAAGRLTISRARA